MICDGLRELPLGIVGKAAICIKERFLLNPQGLLQGRAVLCNRNVIIASGSRAGSFGHKFVCFANADHIVQSERTERDHSDERDQHHRYAQKNFCRPRH